MLPRLLCGTFICHANLHNDICLISERSLTERNGREGGTARVATRSNDRTNEQTDEFEIDVVRTSTRFYIFSMSYLFSVVCLFVVIRFVLCVQDGREREREQKFSFQIIFPMSQDKFNRKEKDLHRVIFAQHFSLVFFFELLAVVWVRQHNFQVSIRPQH